MKKTYTLELPQFRLQNDRIEKCNEEKYCKKKILVNDPIVQGRMRDVIKYPTFGAGFSCHYHTGCIPAKTRLELTGLDPVFAAMEKHDWNIAKGLSKLPHTECINKRLKPCLICKDWVYIGRPMFRLEQIGVTHPECFTKEANTLPMPPGSNSLLAQAKRSANSLPTQTQRQNEPLPQSKTASIIRDMTKPTETQSEDTSCFSFDWEPEPDLKEVAHDEWLNLHWNKTDVTFGQYLEQKGITQ